DQQLTGDELLVERGEARRGEGKRECVSYFLTSPKLPPSTPSAPPPEADPDHDPDDGEVGRRLDAERDLLHADAADVLDDPDRAAALDDRVELRVLDDERAALAPRHGQPHAGGERGDRGP